MKYPNTDFFLLNVFLLTARCITDSSLLPSSFSDSGLLATLPVQVFQFASLLKSCHLWVFF